MKSTLMESRVRSLEEMMADLIATVEQTSLEMRGFKDETRREHRNLNKQLGAIANKQGRMTEDFVAPSICRILQQVVSCPSNLGCGFIVRARRISPNDRSRTKEFDVIAECGDYVLVNETKSKLVPADIDELMVTIQDVREYFPEYRGRRFIGSLATLYADDSMISFATRKGIIILAVGEELMDVMNEPGFKPAEF